MPPRLPIFILWQTLQVLPFHQMLPLLVTIYSFLVPTCLTISPNVATALGNSLPDPLTQSVLDQSRKNHQILGRTEEIFSDFFSCLIAIASKLAGCKNLSLVANACDGPK